MVAQDKSQTDDFFSLLEKDDKIENPFASDEILFRDEKGNIKVLKGGEVLDYEKKDESRPEIQVKDEPKKEEKPKPGLPEENKDVSLTSSLPSEEPVKKSLQFQAVSEPQGKPLDVEKEVNSIIKESKLELLDEDQLRRFKNIIRSRLKGARDQVQTKQILISPSSVGGLGLTSETADRILAIIIKEAEGLDGRLRDEVSNKQFSDLQTEVESILKKPEEFKDKEISQPPKLVFKAEDQKISETQKPEKKIEPVSKAPIEKPNEKPPIDRPIINTDSSKPKIEDVKFQPKLTGPIEEIRTMSLVDFRRLGSTPEQITDKIMEKIDLLEEESFTKRLEAIKAWKESEVNNIYLELGEESMEEKKPIAEVIKDRQQLNKPTLSTEEVEAIMELNKKLRY